MCINLEVQKAYIFGFSWTVELLYFDICEGTETLIYLCVLAIKVGKYWNRLPRNVVECPSFKWSLPEQPDLIRAAFSSVQTEEL